MKLTRLLLLLPFLLMASAGLAAPTTPAGGPASVDAAWAKAFKAMDLEAVMACYAPDAVAWLPDSPQAKGTQAIRESYRAFFAENTVQDVSTSEIRHETMGNRSVSWGTFSMRTLPKATGQPVTATGRFTEVTEKRNGRWVYVVDHGSMDPAPAAK